MPTYPPYIFYYTHDWDNHVGAMGGDVMTSRVAHPLQIVGS
jgi:hypothetical protein